MRRFALIVLLMPAVSLASSTILKKSSILGHSYISGFVHESEMLQNSCALNAVIIYRDEVESVYEGSYGGSDDDFGDSRSCNMDMTYLKRAQAASRPSSLDRFIPLYREFLKEGNMDTFRLLRYAPKGFARQRCHREALTLRFLDHLEYYAKLPNHDDDRIMKLAKELVDEIGFTSAGFKTDGEKRLKEVHCPRGDGTEYTTTIPEKSTR